MTLEEISNNKFSVQFNKSSNNSPTPHYEVVVKENENNPYYTIISIKQK